LDRRLRRTLSVGVLDAQDELTAVMPRERPGKQRGAGAAEMQEARGARRETGADGRHGGDAIDSAARATAASADRAWSAAPDSATRREAESVPRYGRASRSAPRVALRLRSR